MEMEVEQPEPRLPGASDPRHKAAPLPANDAERVDVLRSLSLLDTEEEEAFQRIAQAASATLKVWRACLPPSVSFVRVVRLSHARSVQRYATQPSKRPGRLQTGRVTFSTRRERTVPVHA